MRRDPSTRSFDEAYAALVDARFTYERFVGDVDQVRSLADAAIALDEARRTMAAARTAA